MSISFTGKVAIVTGAGGGLGKQHALELARRGAAVVVNDLGGSVDGSGGSSVSDAKGVEALVKQTLDAFGRIDILINNAGILRDKSFKKMELDDFRVVIDVHLLGTAYCTKAVWPIMLEQNYGRIVMTTSPSGLFGNFGQANYGAAKLGVVGLMNTLKIEGAKNNVRINALAPVAATRMTESLIPKDRLDKLGPELVTPGVVFLCSEEAPTGTILQAVGGRFNVAEIVENEWVDLSADCTVEAVAAQWSKISDLSGAKPRRR